MSNKNNFKVEDIITFNDGLPGFEDLKNYIIAEPEKEGPFYYLQSIEDESIVLAVANPYLFLEDYTPNVSEEVFSELEIEDIEDVAVLSVLVIPKDITKMTTNLVAPILINSKNKKGKQVVLEDSKYQIRFPIYELYKNLVSQEAV